VFGEKGFRALGSWRLPGKSPRLAKVFLLLFFKKEALAYFHVAPPRQTLGVKF
jgi:hypothetical protein